jgi:hypothetical protein
MADRSVGHPCSPSPPVFLDGRDKPGHDELEIASREIGARDKPLAARSVI